MTHEIDATGTMQIACDRCGRPGPSVHSSTCETTGDHAVIAAFVPSSIPSDRGLTRYVCFGCADNERTGATPESRKEPDPMPPKRKELPDNPAAAESGNGKPKRASRASKAATTPSQTMVRAITKSLRCSLSAAELAEKSDRAAHLLGERDALDEEAKSAHKHAKARVAEKEAEFRKLNAQIRDRAEYRDVQCEERHDYRLGRVYTVRLDTDQTIDERAMTSAERQQELPLAKDKDGETRSEAPAAEKPKRRGRRPKGDTTTAPPAE